MEIQGQISAEIDTEILYAFVPQGYIDYPMLPDA